jgi:hypothetical protein
LVGDCLLKCLSVPSVPRVIRYVDNAYSARNGSDSYGYEWGVEGFDRHVSSSLRWRVIDVLPYITIPIQTPTSSDVTSHQALPPAGGFSPRFVAAYSSVCFVMVSRREFVKNSRNTASGLTSFKRRSSAGSLLKALWAGTLGIMGWKFGALEPSGAGAAGLCCAAGVGE